MFTSDIDSIYLIDVLNNSLDHLSSEELKVLNQELQPLFSVIFDELGVKLLDLKPTSMETAYMLCQMVWCVAGERRRCHSFTFPERTKNNSLKWIGCVRPFKDKVHSKKEWPLAIYRIGSDLIKFRQDFGWQVARMWRTIHGAAFE